MAKQLALPVFTIAVAMTCLLDRIIPYTYLIDVLRRIAVHPNKDIKAVTPRLWKLLLVDNPLHSDLYLATQ